MVDILVLGATGVTGKFITEYLAEHSEKGFTFGIAGRSKEKLYKAAADLVLPELPIFIINVEDKKDVAEQIAKIKPKVVINTVGPFWRLAPPVVDACIRNGAHYVDFGGSATWLPQLVHQFDYAAMKAGVMIVPACSYFCLPGDMAAYIGKRTLDSVSGDDIDTSITGYEAGMWVSGGTFHSVITEAEDRHELDTWRNLSISPVPPPALAPKLIYDMQLPDKHLLGATNQHSDIQQSNSTTVMGFTGTLWDKMQACISIPQILFIPLADLDPQSGRYGPSFKYNEFTIASNRFHAILESSLVDLFVYALRFAPIRWLTALLAPKPGVEPPPAVLANGYFKLVNLTTSASQPPIQIKTTIEGKGDPGYLLSSRMISEAALALARDYERLPDIGKQGGVLTPSTAMGDVLVERLKKSGFLIESRAL